MIAPGRLAIVVLALLLPAVASATHQADHRYVVLGYVRDRIGRAVPGAEVRLVREKTGSPYRAETDAEGLYVIVVHLHDVDVRDALRITAGPVTLTTEARFDPRDAKLPRGTQIDFTPLRAVEDQRVFGLTLLKYLNR